MLTIVVLGEVGALRNGARLRLPSGKTAELLARLAVEAGSGVRVDTLVEDLWGFPVDRNTLQAKVSQLRRALGDKDAVIGTPEAYRLNVATDQVDALRAAALARAAAQARAGRDHAATLRYAEEGVALFDGAPLVGQRDWANPYRTAFTEARWTMFEDLFAARVDLGAGADLVVDLERLVAEQPLRERLWASLMTALYRAGRQADALSAYRRVRQHLAEELGLDPGPELRVLETEILGHSETLDSDDGAVALGSAPGNLPQPSMPLVGRDQEVTDLGALLARERLLTLVGPAGVGKTRLALQVAASQPPSGGAWLVRLDTIEPDAAVDGNRGKTSTGTPDLMTLVAETLHLRPDASTVGERLRGAPTLLVLDNCEHVVERAAVLAVDLLAASPSLRLLATSQLPLGVAEEHLVEVSPLTHQDSVALFVRHADRLRKSAAVAAEPELVAEVCRALDGLPLAIELAAARIRSLPLADIARRLDNRFALLRDPTRPTGRRRALEGAIAWSYELLFPDDQLALQALSCFADGATLAAAESVLSALGVPGEAVMDTIGRLVERSLAVLDDTAAGPARYRLLDSVRAYANHRMRQAGAEGAARTAHARWYATQAKACAAQIRGPAQPRWLAFVRAERADVDAALGWCREHDRVQGRRLALGLAWAWAVLGDGSVGAARLRAAVEQDAPAPERLQAALVSAWLEASAGNLNLAHGDLATAEGLVTDDPKQVADLAWYRAFAAIQEGRAEMVSAQATSALAGYRSLELPWETGAALLLTAYGALMVGDGATGAACAHEAHALIERLGDPWGLVHAKGILGGVSEAAGLLDEAAAAFAGAAAAAESMGFSGQAALHRASWARVLVHQGHPAAGEAVASAAAEAAAVADGRVTCALRVHAAQLARSAGDISTARGMLEDNAVWYGASGGGDRLLLTRVLLAALDENTSELNLLRDEALNDPAARQAALDALARLAANSGRSEAAAALLREADGVAVPATDFVQRVDAAMARTGLS